MDFSLHMIIFRERIREAGYAECVEYNRVRRVRRVHRVRRVRRVRRVQYEY